jgi:hypothetical protein
MATGAQQQPKKGLLIDRLGQHIERLKDVLSGNPNDELEKAIADLEDELEDLKIVASHVYGPPPPRRP